MASRKKPAPAKAMANKKAAAPKKVGRPSSFRPEYIRMAKEIAPLGATDADLARIFGVAESTLNLWKKEHPEFSEALKAAKAEADARVVRSLFERACGYRHPAVKIMQDKGEPVIVPYTEIYPPDTVACIFWLKNRQKDEWREKVELSNDPDRPVNITLNLAGKK